ncbi:MAG TPA: zinc ABC transporter substrate-binding protein [Candidatus Methanomethylophilaceae archaeon]|nr:zinc ABC transporter substrate-binding protein [Candidatus Methanomethylophilaceae archaeon]
MRSNATILVSLVAVIALVGSVTVIGLTSDSDDTSYIYTTMSWQQEMVQEIVGDTYVVKSFMLPNSDPHSATLTPGILVSSNTVAYFAIGSDVEWEEKYIDIVRDQQNIQTFECCKELMSAGIMEHLLPGHCHCAHDEAHDESHHHHSHDPHVWTSPERLTLIAKYVRDEMINIDPGNKDLFEEGCASYVEKTTELENSVKEKLSNKADSSIIVWHNSWAYLLPSNVHEIALMETAQASMIPDQITLLRGGTIDNPKNVFLSNELDINGFTQSDLEKSDVYVNIIVLNPLAINWLDELEKAITTFGDELVEA